MCSECIYVHVCLNYKHLVSTRSKDTTNYMNFFIKFGTLTMVQEEEKNSIEKSLQGQFKVNYNWGLQGKLFSSPFRIKKTKYQITY